MSKCIHRYFFLLKRFCRLIFLIHSDFYWTMIALQCYVNFSCCCCFSVTKSCPTDSLWPHGLQHARFPCPSPSSRTCSNSHPLSQWCHPTISSSIVPFSSCLQPFPASILLLSKVQGYDVIPLGHVASGPTIDTYLLILLFTNWQVEGSGIDIHAQFQTSLEYFQ